MTVGIVGLGRIGGSMAKAYSRAEGVRVLAVDTDRTVLGFAMLAGAVDGELTEENLSPGGTADLLSPLLLKGLGQLGKHTQLLRLADLGSLYAFHIPANPALSVVRGKVQGVAVVSLL